MKQKILVAVSISLFILISFYFPPTDFTCGLQEPGSSMHSVSWHPISCANEKLKLLLPLLNILTSFVLSLLLIVGLFLKKHIRGYFIAVSIFFVFSLILRYSLYWYILHLDNLYHLGEI